MNNSKTKHIIQLADVTPIQIIEMGSDNISALSLVLIHSTGLMKNSNERHSSLFSSTAKKTLFKLK